MELAWGWGGLPKVYSIEVSSDRNEWNEVDLPDGLDPNVPIVTARFAVVATRFVGVRIHASDAAYSLKEFDVYH